MFDKSKDPDLLVLVLIEECKDFMRTPLSRKSVEYSILNLLYMLEQQQSCFSFLN